MIYADLQHRYKTILQLVPKGSNLCLDIGGFSSGAYSRLFSEFNISVESINIIQDIQLNNIPTYQNDFFDFSFHKTFDYSFLIDVIEHVHNDSRIIMIEKAIKVAQKGVFILFPYMCKENLELEMNIRNLFVKSNYKIKESLNEHLNYGLPEIDVIFKYLDQNNIKYSYKFVTNRNLFFDLFEKQFKIKDNAERRCFCLEYCKKLDMIPSSDSNFDKYRMLLSITK